MPSLDVPLLSSALRPRADAGMPSCQGFRIVRSSGRSRRSRAGRGHRERSGGFRGWRAFRARARSAASAGIPPSMAGLRWQAGIDGKGHTPTLQRPGILQGGAVPDHDIQDGNVRRIALKPSQSLDIAHEDACHLNEFSRLPASLMHVSLGRRSGADLHRERRRTVTSLKTIIRRETALPASRAVFSIVFQH
jgi:hypothetical protein